MTTYSVPSGGTGDVRAGGLRRHVLALAVYAGLAALVFAPVLPHLNSSLIGNGADPVFFAWFLNWIPFALGHRLNPLLTDWILSQSGINLMWNTSVPLVGFVFAPVTWSAGPVAAYNLAVIAGVAGSAWTGYYAAYLLTAHRYSAALIAGALYGFSSFMISQAQGHLHMALGFTPPLLLVALRNVFVTQQGPPWKSGLALGTLAVAQFFISEEVLATEFILSLVGITILGLAHWRAVDHARARYIGRVIVAAGACAIPVLAYPLLLQFAGPWRPHAAINSATPAADLLSFAVPGPLQALSTPATRAVVARFTNWEPNEYVGLPLLLLLGWAARAQWKAGLVRFSWAMLLVSVLLSLGPSLQVGGLDLDLRLPWTVVAHVPVLREAAPTRLAEYVFLFSSVLLASHLGAPPVAGLGRIARYAVAVGALAFLTPRLPIPVEHPFIPRFFAALKAQPAIDSPALILPYPTDRGTASAMLWQVASGMAFKMPEAYAIGEQGLVGPYDNLLSAIVRRIEDTGRVPEIDAVAAARLVGLLEEQHVKVVILGPCPHAHEVFSFVSHLLGWSPDSRGDVLIWRDVPGRLAHRPGIAIHGGYWPDGWMGEQMLVRVYGRSFALRFSARARPEAVGDASVTLNSGSGGQRSLVLAPSRDLVVVMSPGTTMQVSASPAFPGWLIDSSDRRLLTLSVTITPDTGGTVR